MLKKLLLALFVVTSLQGCFQRVTFADIAKANDVCKGEDNVVFISTYWHGGATAHCSNKSYDIRIK